MLRARRWIAGGLFAALAAIACASCSAARFQYDDETVTDVVEGLMWERELSDPLGWDAAKARCAGLKLSGFKDWRLPGPDENFCSGLCGSGTVGVNRHCETGTGSEYDAVYDAVDVEAFPDREGHREVETYQGYQSWKDEQLCCEAVSSYDGTVYYVCPADAGCATPVRRLGYVEVKVERGSGPSSCGDIFFTDAQATTQLPVRCVRDSTEPHKSSGYYPDGT